MKKIIAILMILVLTMSICATATPVNYGDEIKNMPKKTYEQKFSDVPKDYWAFEYISELVEKNVLSGYPDGMFRPDNIVQRAEFAKIMVGASGLKVQPATTSSFVDVKLDDWYCPYIETAKGFLAGYKMPDGSIIYAPEVAALREDIAVALIKLKGYDVSVADLGMLKTMFSDYESISTVARPYVAVAVERGLISGYPDGTFKAQATIARAEAATLLWRAYQYGNDNKVIDVTSATLAPKATTTPTIEPTATPTSEPIATTTPEPTVTPIQKPYFIETLSKRGISNVTSMALDVNNNLYFLDGNNVKMYDGKSVETIIDCTKLKYTYNITEDEQFKTLNSTILELAKSTDEENPYSYNLTKYVPVSIVYNATDKKMYLLGGYGYEGRTLDYNFNVFYSIETTPSVLRRSFYCGDGKPAPISNDITLFKNDKLYYSIIYESNYGSSASLAGIEYMESDNIEYNYATVNGFVKSKKVIGLFAENVLKILDTENKKILSYDISAKTFKSKDLDEKVSSNGDSSLNGDFYIANGLDIYKVDTKGQVNEFIEAGKIEITDDLSVDGMGKFIFDNNQNIIFFDSINHAIRRITKR